MPRRRRTHVAAALIVSLIALGGCAASETTPSGSPATEGPKSRDTIDCMDMARELWSGPRGPRVSINQDRYQQCMKERGQMTAPAR